MGAASLFSTLRTRLHRKVLNVALRLIGAHVARQPGLFVFVYNRADDILAPITWKARGITLVAADEQRPPSDERLGRAGGSARLRRRIVVDVGANIGGTVARFARTARKVFAIEPHPGNHAFLLDQIRIRKLDNVEPLRLAVSNASGHATFYERESHGIHSLGPHNKGKVRSTFEVEVTTLDQLWQDRIGERVGLLKVDVEGSRPTCSKAPRTFSTKNSSTPSSSSSARGSTEIRDLPADAPLRVLRRHGYTVFTLDGRLVDEGAELPGLCDLIARPAGVAPQ